MIKIGDVVTISPAHSLKFAGWEGIVIDIQASEKLPIRIKFKEDGNIYGFAPEEVIKEDYNGKNNQSQC